MPTAGNRTIKVNARLIAATNRNLKQMVDEGKFRSDDSFGRYGSPDEIRVAGQHPRVAERD
ncbi:MAG: sigma 54-interacting transcriptional regulator [Bryobacteraceae bacterium]|jgi:sigma54-dependent transcription regulator